MMRKHAVVSGVLLCAGLGLWAGCPPVDGQGGGAFVGPLGADGGVDLAGTGSADLAALDLATPDLAMPDLAPPNDPHDPTSCTGPALVFSSKFPMGANNVVLATYTMKYEQRSCTTFTGCGSWGPASPSWGPSGSGKLYLKVTGAGIIPAVVDNRAGSAYGTPLYNLGMDCGQKGSAWDCSNYCDTEIAEGANCLRFEGRDKFSGVMLPVSGEVLGSCARFYGTVKGVTTAGSYKEYRGGFVVRY